MSRTDSVSVFAEGTFEEQIQELVNYIVRNRSEEERGAFIRPFQDAMRTEEGKKPLEEDEEKRRKVFTMILSEVRASGMAPRRVGQIEGFFNLIYSHLFALFSPGSPELKEFLNSLLQIIPAAPSERTAVKYRILSNLFNALPRSSPSRLTVYKTLLDIATTNDEVEVLQISRAEIEKWLSEWDISSEEKSAFFKSIADAYSKTNQPLKSFEFSSAYARSLPSSSPSATTVAVEVIVMALQLPSVFDFDPLLKIDAVVAAKEHELFSLLHIFLNDGLTEFEAWVSSHPGVLEKHSLEKAQLGRKIRLLTLASLGFNHVGHDLPYAKVAEALHIEKPDVEKWVIDVIRAGLLSGKLSQTTQSLHITRSTPRTFERAQWETLEKRLLAWKAGLAGVLDQGVGHVSAHTQTV
ncbi:hypothetical protein BD779DRAFT_1608279 [Infundibulicybe gibba]|nr:hypothetical protein BD779DRAFT_1608279 [Infundibulicybe gibba]